MKKILPLIVLLFLLSSEANAIESTGRGKIIVSQGHTAPACRMVMHRDNSSGVERWFRIADAAGDDDVSPVVLSALVSGKDTIVFYNTGETTGCGSEPKIVFVSIYAN